MLRIENNQLILLRGIPHKFSESNHLLTFIKKNQNQLQFEVMDITTENTKVIEINELETISLNNIYYIVKGTEDEAKFILKYQ